MPQANHDGLETRRADRTGSRRQEPPFAAPDAFFAAALGAGAESLHEPRFWPEYHEHYYGGFVRDPDGNNAEAVCHTAQQGTDRAHRTATRCRWRVSSQLDDRKLSAGTAVRASTRSHR